MMDGSLIEPGWGIQVREEGCFTPWQNVWSFVTLICNLLKYVICIIYWVHKNGFVLGGLL